jgi:3-deoxy-D-manno-octulosonic acid kinase
MVNNRPGNGRGVGNALTADRESYLRTADGAMLYDALCVDEPCESLFEIDDWRQRGAVDLASGGRGTVAFLSDDRRRWVLRHYRRGGMVARFLDDSYLWTGEANTRSFREFRLLWQLTRWQLPVPPPVAARYRRTGRFYCADLITGELPTRATLAELLRRAPVPAERWYSVGKCIGRFHARGVHHADLNANNILLGSDEVYLLDFDRGRIRERGVWEQEVLERLRRSLQKVTGGGPAGRFGDREWIWLQAGCRGG